MEKKPEPRVDVDLLVRVWGMGAGNRPFFQNAHAINISSEGAKLAGLEHPLTPGDVIGAQFGEKKARFRVVWVIDGGPVQKIQAGVQMLGGQECPWKELLEKEKIAAPTARIEPASKNKRQFVRRKIKLPIELRGERDGTHMQTNATDIGGRGCYVEALLPLPVGMELTITFWMDSEKVNTTGIVRASDGGVGMGIEFTGLDMESQSRLQDFLDKLASESGEAAKGS